MELGSDTRPCGFRTLSGKPCAHPVTPESDRCAAGHTVSQVPRAKHQAVPVPAEATLQDALVAEAGTIDIDELLAAPLPPVEEPKELTAEELLAQEELHHKMELAEAEADENAARISAILPENVITLDLDGTMFDSWACCKKKETNFIGDENCRHLRQDTLDEARKLAEEHDAALVVLSWRGGLDKISREWLEHVGIHEEIKAVFIPGGDDDITGYYYGEITSGSGQVDFKVNTVKRLIGMGHNVVASFDDRNTVVKALEEAGSAKGIQVKYKYEVKSYEWSAGYLGAPKSQGTRRPYKSRWGQGSLFDKGSSKKRRRRYYSDPYDYNDSLWDDDQALSREEFDDLVDSGQAVHGRDYTIDGNGEVIPLRRLRDEDDLHGWLMDKADDYDEWQGRDDLMFLDGHDFENENPF